MKKYCKLAPLIPKSIKNSENAYVTEVLADKTPLYDEFQAKRANYRVLLGWVY